MKKNIIIVILAITLILSFVYGQYEKVEAEKQERLAFENAKLAKEAAMQAKEQMARAEQESHMAQMNMAEALKQTQIANEALAKCKKSK